MGGNKVAPPQKIKHEGTGVTTGKTYSGKPNLGAQAVI
jgi:hypothetical protein